MRPISRTATLFLLLLPAIAVGAEKPEPGEVLISLSTWQALRQELARLEASKVPPIAFAVERRALHGTFDRGVLKGDIEAQVVSYQAELAVPIIDAKASLAEVEVDGKPAVAIRNGDLYDVQIGEAGTHRIK